MICGRRSILAAVLLPAVLIAAAARADEADDLLAFAAGNASRGRWEMAVKEYQEFLQKYPHHRYASEAIYRLGEALHQLGKFDEAGDRFRQYLNRAPDGPHARFAWYRAGETAYLAGKYDLARADLNRFRSDNPGDQLNAYVLPYLGKVALARGDVTAAVRHFRAGLDQFPQGPMQDDCRWGLARALRAQGNNQEAAAYFQAVAAKTGSRLADSAQFDLGMMQYAMQEYAAALRTLQAFETRLAQSPWKPNARLGRGWTLLKLNRPAEAKALFQSVAADSRVGVAARYWLAMVQRKEEDWTAAAKTLAAAAAAARPGDKLLPAIRFYAGDSWYRGGDAAAAYAEFDHVITATKPGNQWAGNEWADDAMHGKLLAALHAEDFETLDQTAAEFRRRFPQSSLQGNVDRAAARSWLMRKEHARAAELLEPMVAAGLADKQSMQDRYLLALAYQGLQRWPDATTVLQPVLDSGEGKLEADAQLLQGSLLLAARRYADAVKPLEAYVATNPSGDDGARGRGELAICYARSGQLDQAKRAYAELQQQHPAHRVITPTAEQLARAAHDAKDSQWSTQLYRWLSEQRQSAEIELDALEGLGWSRFQAGDLGAAEAAFSKLLEKDPPPARAAKAALIRGEILAQLGRSDPALAMYGLVIDKYPKTEQRPEALLAAARLHDKLDRNRPAAALFERLAKEYPEHPKLDAVLYGWAWTLNDLGETDLGGELFERIHRQHPRSRYWPDATFRLAQRAFDAKNYPRAGKLTSEILAGKADGTIRECTLYLSGNVAVVEEDWQRAGKMFAELVREFPESPRRLGAQFWIADSTYRRGDYAEAGKLFDRLAEQTKDRREAWLAMVPLRRAQVAAQQNHWIDAYHIASKIEAEFPQFQQQHEVDYLLGRCLASRADFDGARAAYEKVIRSPTGSGTETAAMARWMIGETYFHQKKYAAALREYLRLESRYAYPTWQAAALLQAGKCRDQLGETAEADKLYTELIEEYPHTRFAEEAKELLRSRNTQKRGSAGQIR